MLGNMNVKFDMRYVDYITCCLYRFVPPDVELQAFPKHVKAYY